MLQRRTKSNVSSRTKYIQKRNKITAIKMVVLKVIKYKTKEGIFRYVTHRHYLKVKQ